VSTLRLDIDHRADGIHVRLVDLADGTVIARHRGPLRADWIRGVVNAPHAMLAIILHTEDCALGGGGDLTRADGQ
jgi:hypothetical protein